MLRLIAVVLYACVVTLSAQEYLNLTVTAGPHGTTVPSGTVQVRKDLDSSNDPARIISAYPDSGYLFERWEVVSGEVKVNSMRGLATSSVRMATDDVVMKAHFVERGEVHDITDYDSLHSYVVYPGVYKGPLYSAYLGAVFRFTSPAAGTYRVVIDKHYSSMQPVLSSSVGYFGKDPTLQDGSANIVSYDSLNEWFPVIAQEAGEEHYFIITSNVGAIPNSSLDTTIFISIRYEPVATLTVETSGGYTGTITTSPHEDISTIIPKGEAYTVSASSFLSILKHWEVVSGDVTFTNPDTAITTLVVNSDNAVVQAVFTKAIADTLIVQTDGHGTVNCYDTVFLRENRSERLVVSPNEMYEFDSWTVIDGEVTVTPFGNDEWFRNDESYGIWDVHLEWDTVSVPWSGSKATIRANFRLIGTDPPPEVIITDVDISGHQSISVNVWVLDSLGRGVTGLDASHFTLSEDGVELPFTCTSVAEQGGLTVCMVIDRQVSSNYYTWFQSVRFAAKALITSMGSDDRCAIVTFCENAQLDQEMTGDTVLLNGAVDAIYPKYNEVAYTPQSGLDLGVAQLVEELEPRILIIYSEFAFTPELTNGASFYDYYSADTAINNNVTTYRVNCGVTANDDKITAKGKGFYWMDGISSEKLEMLNKEIRVNFGSHYILTYETPDSIFNGDTHEVIVTVTRDSKVDVDTAYWDESNAPPKVLLTEATEALIENRQPEDTMFTISADVTDDGTVGEVVLYYRPAGSVVSYTEVVMTNTSGTTYSGVIPAEDVHSPGVDFYIVAKDEFNLRGNSPKILYPRNDPWTIFVGDGELMAPIITLTTATWNLIKFNQKEDSSLTVSAVVKDDGALDKIKLFYRTSGSDADYTEASMTIESGSIYKVTIPASAVRSPGVEFYIMAEDDIGLITKSPNIPDEGPWIIPVEKDNVAATVVVKNAAAFADNGYGRVDRVEMYYYRPVTGGELPDSVRICWPDTTQYRIVPQNSLTIDEEDSAHVTVTLSDPFPEGITRFSEWNGSLGTIYQTDSLENRVSLPFAVTDSVGPLIANAKIVERTSETKYDTLVIRFTEEVDYRNLIGQSLTLLKSDGDGVVSAIPLTVSSAFQPENSGYVTVVIPYADDTTAPQNGDSLRITADGPVIDASYNHAHQENRPVVLTIKRDPPEILSAVYEDRDADGRVETVRLIFDETVVISETEFKVEWGGTSQSIASENVRRTGGAAGNDTLDLSIGGAFTGDAYLDITTGPMRLTLRFNDYDEGTEKNVTVEDHAAPVLSAVRYHYGEKLTVSRYAPDTIYVRFSEDVSTTQWDGTALQFIGRGGELYMVATDIPAPKQVGIAGSGIPEKFYRLMVNKAPVHTPVSDDSVWINTDAEHSIADADGNIQNIAMNKRVALYATTAKVHLTLLVGSNPFNPVLNGSATDGVNIRINPEKPVSTELRISANIYDKVGNLVMRLPGDMMKNAGFQTQLNRIGGSVIQKGGDWYIVTRDSSKIWWNGTNRNGRIVADGTYLIRPVIYYTSDGSEEVNYREIRNVPVGVRRVP